MSDKLFGYRNLVQAEAVRDALRHISPVFYIAGANPKPDDKGIYWVLGSRKLLDLFRLAGVVFPRHSGEDAADALRFVLKRQDAEL